MLSGHGTLTLNDISIIRATEIAFGRQIFQINQHAAENIWLAELPEGPAARLAPYRAIEIYVIWNFTQSKGTAKQFLVDLVGNSRAAFEVSRFYNFPCFPQTVPGIEGLILHDPKTTSSDKYRPLSKAPHWTTNLGYPGFFGAAIAEIFGQDIITNMFARAITDDKAAHGEIVKRAENQIMHIFAKWK
jgi:multiple sugar transport system substrate-binding protein